MSDSPPSSAAGTNGPAIRTAGLTRRYGTGAGAVCALREVTVEVGAGERVALLGKSGSGKSTLLNILGGLDRPTAGSVVVAGCELSRLSARELARFRSASVGMIFQSFHLVPSRTALENVELPMIFSGVPPRERRREARRALEGVGLAARLDHRPAALSGGENQRVAVARALVNRPRVVLADEPTGNLDSATAHEVLGLILDHVRTHQATLVLVTHDEDLAGECTTRVLRLKDGELLPAQG